MLLLCNPGRDRRYSKYIRITLYTYQTELNSFGETRAIRTRCNILLCGWRLYLRNQIARTGLFRAVILTPGHISIEGLDQHASIILGQGFIAINLSGSVRLLSSTTVGRKLICRMVSWHRDGSQRNTDA